MDSSDSNLILYILVQLKGFVFAILGLIGIFHLKKNKTVAALFLLSTAIGSIFSFQFFRGAIFIGLSIFCFRKKENHKRPIDKYIIEAFLPMVITLVFVFTLWETMGISLFSQVVDKNMVETDTLDIETVETDDVLVNKTTSQEISELTLMHKLADVLDAYNVKDTERIKTYHQRQLTTNPEVDDFVEGLSFFSDYTLNYVKIFQQDKKSILGRMLYSYSSTKNATTISLAVVDLKLEIKDDDLVLVTYNPYQGEDSLALGMELMEKSKEEYGTSDLSAYCGFIYEKEVVEEHLLTLDEQLESLNQHLFFEEQIQMDIPLLFYVDESPSLVSMQTENANVKIYINYLPIPEGDLETYCLGEHVKIKNTEDVTIYSFDKLTSDKWKMEFNRDYGDMKVDSFIYFIGNKEYVVVGQLYLIEGIEESAYNTYKNVFVNMLESIKFTKNFF